MKPGAVRPFGRKRHQPNVALGGFLEAMELGEIGRPDPARRMRAARPIVGGNVGALQMESLHRRSLPRMDSLALARLRSARGHVLGRAGNHGGEETRDAAANMARMECAICSWLEEGEL